MADAHIEKTEKEPETPTEISKKSPAFYLSVFWLCLVSVITSLDSVIITAIIPSVAKDLPGTTVQLFWCGTGFLLAQTVSDVQSIKYFDF